MRKIIIKQILVFNVVLNQNIHVEQFGQNSYKIPYLSIIDVVAQQRL